MNKDKISSQEIIDLISSKASISKRAAEEFLKMLFLTIEDALLAGEVVKIKNFGTFKLQWNAPRKSVNIQTGEEILLAGYSKVSFVPDSTLKELVNEPFSHLEAVELEAENDVMSIEEQNEIILDPLRIFTEQATEIKSLISEIQALSPKARSPYSKTKAQLEQERAKEPKSYFEELEDVAKRSEELPTEEITADDIAVLELVVEIEKPIPATEPAHEEIPLEISEPQIISPIVEEYVPNEFLENIKPLKKRKKGWWILLIIIFVAALKLSLYFFCPPVTAWVDTTIVNCENTPFTKSIQTTLSYWYESVSSLWTPTRVPKQAPIVVVVPNDTVNESVDTIQNENLEAVDTKATEVVAAKPKAPTVDSLQILFDTPRVYRTMIASERIGLGSRLTVMSKHYYGTSDFWVYIYEANKDRITHPDRIASGTLIQIPKLDSRLIDASNPRCMKKARELHDLYVK